MKKTKARNTNKAKNKSKNKRKRYSKANKFKQFKKTFFEKLGLFSFLTIITGILLIGLIVLWEKNQESVNDFSSINYEVRRNFVEEIAPIAQKLQRQYGIFASVSMAQAMLESEFGQSGLASDYHNLFGVKTEMGDPNGVNLITSEFVNGQWIEITDRFKVYPSWAASMEAHAQLLVNGTSWDADFYTEVTDGQTPHEQAKGLQSAGYATDPDYAIKLINMMDEWDLYQYNQPNFEVTNHSQ